MPASARFYVTDFFQIKINYSLIFPLKQPIGFINHKTGTRGLTNLKKSGTRGRQGRQGGRVKISINYGATTGKTNHR